MTRRPERATAFFAALAANRKRQGHCTRCGRKLDNDRDGGKCEKCRQYVREYKARMRHETKPIGETTSLAEKVKAIAYESELQVFRLRQELSDFRRVVKTLRTACRSEYNRGYCRGVYSERRKRMEWESWKEALSFEDRKQHFHRFAEACANGE